MTVSRAFRTESSVGEQTRERVLRVAEELGYIFDQRASNLRSQRSGFVAATVPTIGNAMFAQTVDALSLEVSDHGMQLLLGYDRHDASEEERIVEQLLRHRPEAIVVTGARHSTRCRRLLATSGIPVVETWDIPEKPIEHVVGVCNTAALRLAVDHLVGLGRRRIAFVGGDYGGNLQAEARRDGFVAAMEAHGLDPSWLVPMGGPCSIETGVSALARQIAAHPDTEAFVGASDRLAYGALTECQRQGIRVPDDMAIVGFGGTEMALDAVPSLTTVDPNSAEIGRRTGRLVTDLLEGPVSRTVPVRIEISAALRVGQSTRGRLS